jgi:glycine/D-amino acid oxidase-like deaminating enzyme
MQNAMTRRQWLKAAGLSASGALLTGCTAFPFAHLPSYRRPLSALPFARPAVSPDRLIRTLVGLRPFRAPGFVVRGEKMADKLVIHNYGHGGAGITLSLGSAALALRELPDTPDRRAAVIGAGALGLATARKLQERGYQVTLYARDLPPNTTSNVAGGLWAPTSAYSATQASPAFLAQLREALAISHHEFGMMVGAGFGVTWKENYHLDARPNGPETIFYLREFPELFHAVESLNADQHPFDAPHVLRYVSLLIEPGIYLRRQLNDFHIASGKVVVREMRSREEVLTLPEPILFNCTGLGAKDLFGDSELVPVRGQLAFMPPDERVDFLTHGGGQGLLYMFPRADGILLGGTYERGLTHLAPDRETTDRIVREHARLYGAMRV